MSDVDTFLKAASGADPRKIAAMLDAHTMSKSLMEFVKGAWHIIEPKKPFVGNWHISAIVEHLEAVERGEIKRLIINIPPRHSKSSVVSVLYPLWVWTKNPSCQFMCGSYAEKLAVRDNLKHRRVGESQWYRDRWGDVWDFSGDQNQKTRFENNKSGYRICFGMTGGAMGDGADRLLLDDPLDRQGANSETERTKCNETYDEALSTRLNDPANSAIILIMQRLHQADLTGHLLDGDEEWTHLMCYDGATEILTKNGWVRFDNLNTGIDVLGVNPQTLKARWETPAAYIRKPFHGEMIRYKSLTCDLLVTPDHRMVYRDRNDPDMGMASKWRVRHAHDLPNDFYVPQVVKWESKVLEISCGGRIWKSSDYAEFMGWFLSEGCANGKTRTVRLVQSKLGRYVNEIDNVLSRTPFHVTKYSNSATMFAWQIKDRFLAKELTKLGQSKWKVMPEVLKSLSPSDLQIFLMAYAKGDGSFGQKNKLKITIATSSPEMANDLQECAIKAGWSATLNVCHYKYKERMLEGHAMPQQTIMYKVYIRISKGPHARRKTASEIRSKHTSLVPYNDLVYCVSVPSTAIVVRRNGRVTISGNCPAHYDSSRHCVTQFGNTVWEDPRSEDGDLLWPERFSESVIDTLAGRLGPFGAASQLEQSPVPKGGGIIKEDWWQDWPPADYAPPPAGKPVQYPACSYVVASLDSAFTSKEENDPSALVICGVWHDASDAETRPRLVARDGTIISERVPGHEHQKIILQYAWEKWVTLHGPPEEKPRGISEAEWNSKFWKKQRQESWGLVEWVIDTCRNFKVDRLLIEGKASGIDVANEMARLYANERFAVELVQPHGDKVSRVYAIAPLFSNGRIHAPFNYYHDGKGGGEWRRPAWCDAVIRQTSMFPKAEHDDLTDALSMNLRHLRDIGMAVRSDEQERDWEEELIYKPKSKFLYEV